MKHHTYAYIRVSTKDQKEDRQYDAMINHGIKPEFIFLDKQSGKDFDRPQYQRLLGRLKEKDTLVIKSIDRLGRDYNEILNQWRILTKEKKVYMEVLDLPLLNTHHKNQNLTGVFISDLVLQILSYVAQTERENIKKRQAEGIASAKKRGIRFGRSPMEIPDQFFLLYPKWQNGQISARQAAAMLSVSHPTFLKWTRVATTRKLK